MTGDRTARVTYLSTLDFPAERLAALRAVCPRLDVEQVPAARADAVPAALWRRVDVLHTSTALPDPAAAPRLRWVQLDTSGADHVRPHPLWDSGIDVTTIGGVSPVPLAEYVLFAVLGFAHRLPALLAARGHRRWPDTAERWSSYGPAPVTGTTMTVVGYGRIGAEIGRRAAAHGIRVLGVSRTGRPSAYTGDTHVGVVDDAHVVEGTGGTGAVERFGPDRLHEALARADHVVVAVPLTDRTRGLLDAAALAAVKPGAVVVNVSRGGVVDEDALLAAVRSGAVAGAALDVFADEPLPADSPWWDEPNVLVTPHVAGLAPDYEERVTAIVTENLRRFLAGRPLLNRVDREAGY